MAMATTSLLRTAAGPVRGTLLEAPSRSFSSTSAACAAKKGAPKVQQKRKTPIRKSAGSSGPRSPRRGQTKSAGVHEGLSKTNPFVKPVADMSFLATLLPEQATEANVGQVMAWSERTLEATRIQGFGLTREMAREFKRQPRPRTLLRPQSLRLFNHLDSSVEGATGHTTLLEGPLGAGASTLLLQAVSYALESDWLVVYIPRGINLVDSSSPFVYSSSMQTYVQPEASRALLGRILSVNGEDKLREIAIDDGSSSSSSSSLADVIKQALGEQQQPAALQRTLETALRTLVQQRQRPLLLCLDGAQAYFSTTKYRDADYRRLQAYELGLTRTVLSCMRTQGAGSFGGVQRGLALAAPSPQHAEWWPWTLSDDTHRLHHAEAAFARLDIGRHFTNDEAASLFDVARRELNRGPEAINDESYLARLATSGASLSVFERSLNVQQ